MPVALPPGRLRLVDKTSLDRIDGLATKTIGIVDVAAFAASAPLDALPTITNDLAPNQIGRQCLEAARSYHPPSDIRSRCSGLRCSQFHSNLGGMRRQDARNAAGGAAAKETDHRHRPAAARASHSAKLPPLHLELR